MKSHYNVVVSMNFKTEEEREEYLKLHDKQPGCTILYKGIHRGDILQKVTTIRNKSLFNY
jgi:hypothetical protein